MRAASALPLALVMSVGLMALAALYATHAIGTDALLPAMLAAIALPALGYALGMVDASHSTTLAVSGRDERTE